jgi:putative membrane protein
MENHSLFYYAIHWAVSAIALLVTAKFMGGWKVKGFGSALIAAAVIGVADAVIWPILIVLTLPINILTLGLFTFVVNGAVLKICATLLDGFDIEGWFSAIFGALLLAIVSTIFHFVLV